VTYINRPVRADEHVEAPGSVVVHGDVAADASISAAGDVMVWGRWATSKRAHTQCATELAVAQPSMALAMGMRCGSSSGLTWLYNIHV
jgi:hypothetical protein